MLQPCRPGRSVGGGEAALPARWGRAPRGPSEFTSGCTQVCSRRRLSASQCHFEFSVCLCFPSSQVLFKGGVQSSRCGTTSGSAGTLQGLRAGSSLKGLGGQGGENFPQVWGVEHFGELTRTEWGGWPVVSLSYP